MASSQRPAQLAAHAPERQPPLALAEPAFPMSGHTFEVMDQEFNAWWKQIMANKPQPERNLTVINDAMAHSPLGHS